ncbi:esterase/lipase family protein [Psychrobacter aestuarii]|uniref:Alpha/beta fold hydrolase n=1 Tax=Psychrobacter aestuarii TaxID=556327 RepID=A0ABP3FPT7_9GAMM|nr:alpha/beta hydrolase [Psychrobacter aestuarii]
MRTRPRSAPTTFYRQFRLRLRPVCLGILMTSVLSACSVVSVKTQSSSKTIAAQRGNIVSENTLSTDTASALLSAGLNDTACLQQFDICLTQLTDSLLNQPARPELAIFSELHYAKARSLATSSTCRDALARPPLDPYYANAEPPPEQARQQEAETRACLLDYQHRLFDALKYSYAYLFFDRLEHDYDGAAAVPDKPMTRIPTDMDIQTQDIYNAASSDIITQLYDTESIKRTGVIQNNQTTYLSPTLDTLSDDTSEVIANKTPRQGPATAQVHVMQTQIDNYRLDTYLPNESSYLQNARNQTSALADLMSTYELRLSGLNSISKRPGLGVSFVASLDDRYTTTIRSLLMSSLSGRLSQSSSDQTDPTSRIYPTGHLLMTGLIRPQGNSVLDVLASEQLDIHLYNPYRSETVNILGNQYPLAANFSAGYGLWLAENQLSGVGYLNLLAHQKEAALPKLFMLEPYDPDKRVIIMIHGLASSPATWVNLTNDIFNDDKLRENYQVWQVFYPTNLPILENRYQIQKLLAATYQQTDPTGSHRASRNSVIVSHSMGAVIARMMLADDDLTTHLDALDGNYNLLNSNERAVNDMLRQAFTDPDLAERFDLHPLPQVDTAVFLSAPFRGTDYADRWFTRAIRRIIYLPINVVKTVTDNLATIATQGELAENPLGALYLQNGASQLSDKSSFIQLTKDIKINPSVTYHSIIASNDEDITQGLAQMQPNDAKIDLSKASAEPNENDPTAADMPAPPARIAAVMVDTRPSQALTQRLSDGIVPYKSAHLDGAASETIISGGHSIQENPQTVLTLRRILHSQLQH